jgi:hypothetical protein
MMSFLLTQLMQTALFCLRRKEDWWDYAAWDALELRLLLLEQ